MAFRDAANSSIGPTSYYPPNVNTQSSMSAPQQAEDAYPPGNSPTIRSKRPRPLDMQQDEANSAAGPPSSVPSGDAFINDHEAADEGASDDDDEEVKGKSDKKAGRRKIKIEFIQDKSRRHITFSKRKAGIMKKAYELSTLTGTQVLLLVVSETGLVYTFTTAKLQPLVTQPEGKNLIQACLNAPHGQLPSSMPVGAPIGRSSNPSTQPSRNNVPGGLSIGGVKNDDGEGDDDDDANGPQSKARTRRRTSSGAVPGGLAGGPGNKAPRAGSPSSPSQAAPPTPTMLHQQGGPPQSQIALNSPTNAHGPSQGAYSQQNPNNVPNVGYSNPGDGGGGFMQTHPHAGHPQMMAQYHLGQHNPQAPPQQPQHWSTVSQSAQYGRR